MKTRSSHAACWLATVVITVTVANLAGAAEFFVPSEYPTIQAAVDAAESGDTVWVAPGTYFENVVITLEDIALRSEEGREVTIIDGMQNGPVVFLNGVGTDGTVAGFTIRNGSGWYPDSWRRGGGVMLYASSATIENNTITESFANFGGGVCIVGGAPVVRGNRIEENVADFGGGIATYEPETLIEGNVICNNHAFSTWLALLTDEFFIDAGVGGGVWVQAFVGDPVRLTNNLICANTSETLSSGSGGGIYTWSDLDLRFNTIVGNDAGVGWGGGIMTAVSSSCPPGTTPEISIDSCIIAGNTADIDPQIYPTCADFPTIGNSIVEGGQGGALDVDPGFTSGPFGEYYLSHTAAGDPFDSPAIDAGNPALPAPDGTSRSDEAPDIGVPDMGFHYPIRPPFIRGDANIDGSIDIADAIQILTGLFVPGTSSPLCTQAGDTNDDDAIDIADPIYLLGFLFAPGASPPPEPFGDCGGDPTPSLLPCAAYTACP